MSGGGEDRETQGPSPHSFSDDCDFQQPSHWSRKGAGSDMNFISGQMQNKIFSEKCLRYGAFDLHHSGQKLDLESGESLPFWVCKLSAVGHR